MGPLRILEIEIDNFKTFRHETIPLMPGFTAISGPNGSGKSNILDALLFALGLGSNRTLRAEKATDLINNGSARREARVTVRFGTGGDETDLEIARRVREVTPPGGVPATSSTYYFNGKIATLADVHDILARHHISPSGYNVVMQGDVTSIIRMTTTERRKIIDEVAGVADFDYRIEQARKELETVLDQEDRTRILLLEIASRLDGLRAERDQALKHRDLTAELERCELAGKVSEWWEAREKVKGLEELIAASSTGRFSHEQALAEAQQCLETARQHEADILEQLRREGGPRLEALENMVVALKSDIEKARIEREAADGRATELDDSAGRDDWRAKDLLSAIGDLDKQQRELETVRERHISEAEIHFKRKAALEAELDVLMAGQQEVAAQDSELRAKSAELYAQINKLSQDRLNIEAQRSAIENRLKARGVERATHLAQLKQAEADQARLTEAVERATIGAQVARDDEDRSRTNVENLRRALAQVEAAASEARNRFNIADQGLKAQEATMGTAVDFVLSQGLPGVIGTLLQLGEAEPQFARALQEAAGGRLKNIVVEDDSVAAKVGRLVNAQKVGRVTCLPLNKLQAPRKLQSVRASGCLGYAIDKVRFDPQYAAAFSLAFGETLVFETMDHARPHIGTHRMVTLDGDLLDRTGAMTMGRSRNEPAQFLSNLKVAFEEAQGAFQAAAQRVASHQMALKSMEEAVTGAEARRRQADSEVHTAQLELNTASRGAVEAQGRLVEDDAALHADEIEVSGFDQEVERILDAQFPFEDEFSQVELALEELKDSLGNEHISALKDDAQKAGWAAADEEAQAKRSVTETADLRRRREAIVADRRHALESRERHLTDAAEARKVASVQQLLQDNLAAELEAAEAERVTASAGLEKLRAEREAAGDARRRLETTVEDRQRDLDRLEDGVKQMRDKLSEQAGNLLAMENKLWEEGIALPEERPPLTSAQVDATRKAVSALLAALGPVNQLAVEHYDREALRATDLKHKVDALGAERGEIESRIADISGQKKAVFMKAFDQIAGFFGEIFGELAAGTGRLSLEVPADPFTGGLVIHAQPPGSKVVRLEAMSGGEKSLTALAFLFAIQRTQPAPFYALDEVDHALDGVNDERLARMIKRQSDAAQMVVISHRKPMISNSDQAIGVHARPDGSTRVTGISWGRPRPLAMAAGE